MLIGVKSQGGDNRSPWVITGEENGRMYILLGGNGEPEVYKDRQEAEARALFISSGKMDPDPEPEPEPEPEPVRKGCFLTTACEVALGDVFKDDGIELETLRFHRDRLAKENPYLQQKVLEYYAKAPQIVACINHESDSRQRYQEIYDSLIVPTSFFLENGQDEKAIEHYYQGFQRLCLRYGL